MSTGEEAELKAAVDAVLGSKGANKLVVAGPGSGKTFLFRKLLEQARGAPAERVVLTFINNLKADLERNLGHLASVFTLHGFCQALLYSSKKIRNGLTEKYQCYPGLISLIKVDWRYLRDTEPPKFVELMRDLKCDAAQWDFYRERSNYYDAVDFDDSVYRVLVALQKDDSNVPEYQLVLVDEFQDFNKMEAQIIDALDNKNSSVVAGDDDQALYSQLRGASWEYIRGHFKGKKYEKFSLPFCMRCTQVVVRSVNEFIAKAIQLKKLQGRIDKPYRYYPPVKGKDSDRFPKIDLITTSVQRENANYFGKYIEQSIGKISEEEFREAADKYEPAVLVIGSDPYRRQVAQFLIKVGLLEEDKEEELSAVEAAYQMLLEDENSNLAWRIVLADSDEEIEKKAIVEAAAGNKRLSDVLDQKFKDAAIKKAALWAKSRATAEKQEARKAQRVKIVSFEGSKGLSAQYVFVIGCHSGEIPRKGEDIQDIEICKFLVALTRTKKQCTVMVTRRFGEGFKEKSEFLKWIDINNFRERRVDAKYWKAKSAI